MIIGLTGGSGSGKTTVGRAAADLGFYVIDADKIGHEILLKGNKAYNETVNAFGSEILAPDGEIDRKKLGGIVFSDKEKLKLLNDITHEKITKAIEKLIKICENKKVIIDAAVLFESGMDKKCDYVIAVVSSAEERTRRICHRDGISPEAADNRIKSQQSDDFYSSKADRIIINNGNESQLYIQAKMIIGEVEHGKT